MSRKVLDSLRKRIEELEAEGITEANEDEYDKLSDDYQALALNMLPMWDDIMENDNE